MRHSLIARRVGHRRSNLGWLWRRQRFPVPAAHLLILSFSHLLEVVYLAKRRSIQKRMFQGRKKTAKPCVRTILYAHLRQKLFLTLHVASHVADIEACRP